MRIEEVCDARIGMCVCVRVPLMHSRSRCRASCVTPAAGIQAVVKSAVGASDHSHRPSRHSSSCDKRALKKGTPKPLQRFTERHHNPSQAVVFMYVGHSAASSLSIFGTRRNVWKERRMDGRTDGWKEGWMEGGGSLLLRLSLSPSIWRVCWWRGSVLHFHP